MLKNDKSTGTNDILTFLSPALILTAIAVIIAFLLAIMNSFTAPVIAEHKENEKTAAIEELFGDGIKAEVYDISLPTQSSVYEVLKVTKNDELIGYCVGTAPKGFSGKIDILVALTPENTIKKVKIIDMSETAGIGTKTAEDGFLGQFENKTPNITTPNDGNNSIDTISGATVSSKAVLKGINAALEVFEGGNSNSK